MPLRFPRAALGLALTAAWVLVWQTATAQEQTTTERFEREYSADVQPLLQRFCYECHADGVTEADLDLSIFTTVDDVRQQTDAWLKVREMLDSQQMPPPEAPQPSEAEGVQLKKWIRAVLAAEAERDAGDPGPIVLRRLSNAEYTYAVRDLTRIESLEPTKEFPIDGAAGEGFTNVGSGQGMSPALVQKYLDAAKKISQHVVLLPRGIRFSPHTSSRDQTDELLARIQSFYRRFTADGGGTAVDLQGIKFETNQGGVLPVEKYLAATVEEGDALMHGRKPIGEVARERGLNARYLGTLWSKLNEPAATKQREADSQDPILLDALREKWRQADSADVAALAAEIAAAQEALWKFNPVGHIGREGGPARWMEAQTTDTAAQKLGIRHAGSAVETAISEFRELFPPALCYARIVPVDEVVTLTLFYREDDHLKRLMLDDQQADELDGLWEELYYVSQEPLKQVVVFEQILEFASQDRPDLVEAFAALREPIQRRADAFRERLAVSEASHVAAVQKFADRAWRRPLTAAERQNLRELYGQLRSDELPHDEAIRLTLARVLTSPAFLYKLEQPGPGKTPAVVTDLELASRLSFFLWSSVPDEELREIADAGRLGDEQVLVAQARRQLRDPRMQRLAVQFACQWLHLQGFDQNDDKNEKLYPEFAELRGSMYRETVLFFEDMFRNDGSIVDILDADHTFLNEELAEHYGIDWPVPQSNVRDDSTGARRANTVRIGDDAWQRVAGMRGHGRGGVLGMAAILASQSGASRTSPILRGNWVYETLLGERLPRPPAGVPSLPEMLPSGLTERELIERHSSDAACARCHRKIDPYGFALEQFDAIGRQRHQKVDATAELPNGQSIDGIGGLCDYLMQQRRSDFVGHFCRKLLGYALGRQVQLSDEPLLAEMQEQLEANDFRFHVAIEAIVTSPQFRQIRGQDAIDR